jgi:hypothetical protein
LEQGGSGGLGIILGLVGLLAFVGLIVWFVVWYARKANARYAQLWPPLAALVVGAYKGNALNGTYQGFPVRARLNAVSDGDNGTDYFWEVSLTAEPGGRDWKLQYKQRLAGTGVLGELANWGAHPTVSYKAKAGEFEYRESARNSFDFPAPERFGAQLELLARLASVNRQVNAA